jgi:DNA polymerase type B, organellar and viral
MDRTSHWIKARRQERMPPRMVAIDTESKSHRSGKGETQTWRTGCAIRWRNDLATGDHAEGRVFDSALGMWQWIDDFCRKETRTVVWAHNLSHDVRIASAMTILPGLGFQLEWCNLDRNVSAMIWRSDHGTLVLADTYTWVPVSAAAMAPMVGLVKFTMPNGNVAEETWDAYCMRDAQIVYRVASEICAYIRDNHLGNWQPTGAGMAYATWRHKYMPQKVLVHDNDGALQAERNAMHTGRAEAWRHGVIYGEKWTEVDMRNAYLAIARECELPRKLMYHTGAINYAQYRGLLKRYRIVGRCEIVTDCPVVPYHNGKRTLWPVGQFTSWLWDTEISCALRYGATVKIREAYVYARGPILRDWAEWITAILTDQGSEVSPIVRTWLKHCSRALIGRMSLRSRSWELFGANPTGETGISRQTDVMTGQTRRMMHVGNRTYAETEPKESRDAVPMVTSWIMAECRVRLWEAMNAAGLGHLAHVDTDSMVVSTAGLAAFTAASGGRLAPAWAIKGTWQRLAVYGPRHYYRGRERVISGIPLKADEVAPGQFTGEKWASMALDLTAFGDGVVTTWHDTWAATRSDPRRRDAPGVTGRTDAYEVCVSSSPNRSPSPSAGDGS